MNVSGTGVYCFDYDRDSLVLSTVGTFAIPVSLAVTLNHMAAGTGDGDVGSRDDNGIKVVVEGISECLSFLSQMSRASRFLKKKK